MQQPPESGTRAVSSRLWGAAEWCVVLACCLAAYVYTYLRGPDVNFDGKNYHLYDAFMYLDDRWGTDVNAVGNILTYQNPQGFTLAYWLRTHLYFPWSDWTLATVQLAALPLLLWLARRLIRTPPSATRFAVVSLTLVLAFLSPYWFSELGTSFSSSLLGPLVLIGLILLSYWTPQATRLQRMLLLGGTGACVGLATGLKLVVLVFAVAMIIPLLIVIVERNWKRLAGGISVFVLGGLVGVLPTIPWYSQVQSKFGNPVFPFYNSIFKSPYWEGPDFRDLRWKFNGFKDLAEFVTTSAFTPSNKIAEIPSADPRPLILFVLVLCCLVLASVRLMRHKGLGSWDRTRRFQLAVVAFVVTAFLIWAVVFAYGRYWIPGEQLVALAILALLLLVGTNLRVIAGVIAVCALASAVTFQAVDWGHNSGWKLQRKDETPLSQRFGFHFSETRENERADYLLVGGYPFSYITLMLNPSSTFIGVPAPSEPFLQEVESALSTHPERPKYLVLHDDPSSWELAAISLEQIRYRFAESRKKSCTADPGADPQIIFCRVVQKP